MENTFLMNPFTTAFNMSEEEDSLQALIRPLIALSHLKDVRSVSVNINEYILKEQQIMKLEEAIADEEQSNPSLAKASDLDNSLPHEEHCFAFTHDVATTKHIQPGTVTNYEIRDEPMDPDPDDVVPCDEVQRQSVTGIVSRASAFPGINKLFQFSKAYRNRKELKQKKTLHKMETIKNNTSIVDNVNENSNRTTGYPTKPALNIERILNYEEVHSRNLNLQPNFPAMHKPEDESRGEKGSKSARLSSLSSVNLVGSRNFSQVIRNMRLQSYNEIDEILQRMNSTARKLA
jgi:hypothetical protein